jgi:hypothetical protein
MSWLSFIFNMLTSTCMAPNCTIKAKNYPHGIPCCDEHYHEGDCACWVGGDCDCGKEA